MVLQKLQLGRRANFVTGSNYSGWPLNVFRILPLIIGVASLATTLLLGSFFWRFVTRRRKNRKQEEIPVPVTECHSLPEPKPNTIVSLRDFLKATPAFSPKVADHDRKAYSDDFDPEEDYEQILAEARSHAGTSHIGPDSVAKHSLVENWLARSPDFRRHDFSLEQAEAVFERHQAEILQSQRKSSKSWKKLFFWKRSKKTNNFEFNLNGTYSSSTTPIHHLFKSSRTRATVAPSSTSALSSRNVVPKRSSSGPIYYDGVPRTPNRNTRPFSSPLSGFSTPSRDDGLYEPTYIPLTRPYSSNRTCPSPLYIP